MNCHHRLLPWRMPVRTRLVLALLALVALAASCASSRVAVTTTVHAPDYFANHDQIEANGIRTIAVVALKELGTPLPDAWELVTEELNLQIGKATGFQLVERLRIDQLLNEMRLAPGIVDETKARQIGRMLGADAVILGTLRLDPEEWSLSARLVEVESGLQDWNARVHATSSEPGTWVLSPNRAIRELCTAAASTLTHLPRQGPRTIAGSRGLNAEEQERQAATIPLTMWTVGGLIIIVGLLSLL